MEDRLGALRQNMLADFLLVDMTGESGGAEQMFGNK